MQEKDSNIVLNIRPPDVSEPFFICGTKITILQSSLIILYYGKHYPPVRQRRFFPSQERMFLLLYVSADPIAFAPGTCVDAWERVLDRGLVHTRGIMK